MVLPLLPTAPGDSSPYATRCAFGLNPLFIDLHALPEFHGAGGEAALSADERAQLDEARAGHAHPLRPGVPAQGRRARAAPSTPSSSSTGRTEDGRAQAFDALARAQGEWLESYALFTAISEDQQHRGRGGSGRQALRDREPGALQGRARTRLERERPLPRVAAVGGRGSSGTQVRAQAKARGVLLCGDEPFIIGQDSADAWAQPGHAPPRRAAGRAAGRLLRHRPGLGPALLRLRRDGEGRLRAGSSCRAQKAASYYDLRRVDHAVGYFRQWIRDEQTPTGRFVPRTRRATGGWASGTSACSREGAGIVAEDLGVIPPFVREMLDRAAAARLPGDALGAGRRHVYRDPHQFPAVSLVTTGTHDTETMARVVGERPATTSAPPWPARGRSSQGVQPSREEFTPEVHRALLAAALNSGSDLCVLPWQDVLGTRERINLPGTMSDSNWAYRITQDVEELC